MSEVYLLQLQGKEAVLSQRALAQEALELKLAESYATIKVDEMDFMYFVKTNQKAYLEGYRDYEVSIKDGRFTVTQLEFQDLPMEYVRNNVANVISLSYDDAVVRAKEVFHKNLSLTTKPYESSDKIYILNHNRHALTQEKLAKEAVEIKLVNGYRTFIVNEFENYIKKSRSLYLKGYRDYEVTFKNSTVLHIFLSELQDLTVNRIYKDYDCSYKVQMIASSEAEAISEANEILQKSLWLTVDDCQSYPSKFKE